VPKKPAPNHRLDHARFIVPPGSSAVSLAEWSTDDTGGFASKADAKRALNDDIDRLADAQELLWATKDRSLLIILQAMDAAGKDGTIKHVLRGINPQGCSVHAFGPPSDEERLHHFLWRPIRFLPERGRIAIFNRSYYEEVLVVRVHPRWLDAQWTPVELRGKPLEERWRSRYDDINEFEHRLTRHGLVIVKIFLHLSKDEQRERLLARLENTEKHWKFNEGDLTERERWDDYQRAYGDMLAATSTDHAPWHVVPADHKWFSRAVVADIIAGTIERLDLKPPKPSPDLEAKLPDLKRRLEEG
jgi:PPK2 family polyphosphate:nucleotide phosphotransferase